MGRVFVPAIGEPVARLGPPDNLLRTTEPSARAAEPGAESGPDAKSSEVPFHFLCLAPVSVDAATAEATGLRRVVWVALYTEGGLPLGGWEKAKEADRLIQEVAQRAAECLAAGPSRPP